MEKNSHLLIKKHPGRGWYISRCRQKIGTAANVVDAIDLTNRLSERECALYQREIRVLFIDDKPEEEDGAPE